MREPNALISTEALARELGDSNLRIFDCTTYLEPPPPGSDVPYIAVPAAAASRPRTSLAPTFSIFKASSLTAAPGFAS